MPGSLFHRRDQVPEEVPQGTSPLETTTSSTTATSLAECLEPPEDEEGCGGARSSVMINDWC